MKKIAIDQDPLKFYDISRSHLYWGRKHTNSLFKVLESLKENEILIDPFCGAGTPTFVGLQAGAKVLASDLNPMALLLTKVLVKPISLFTLNESFERLEKARKEISLQPYLIKCPKCHEQIDFEYIMWNSKEGQDIPEAVKVNCKYCKLNKLIYLGDEDKQKQIHLSSMSPDYWYPDNKIFSQRILKKNYFYELFTGRNLSILSGLFHCINNEISDQLRDFFFYIFTSMLYSCSSMQMFSEKEPSSSRGWTAPRFYLPVKRQEKNVWNVFETRFKRFLEFKRMTNSSLNSVNIANSMKEFESTLNDAYIYNSDFKDFKFPSQQKVSHVFLDPPYNLDIDYLGFSEFWGAWLQMKFNRKNEWNPGKQTSDQFFGNMKDLLLRVNNNTDNTCKIILAYGSKKKNTEDLIQECISNCGYSISQKVPIILDHSQRRKTNGFTINDQYFVLKKGKARKSKPTEIDKKELNEIKSIFRTTAYLNPDKSTEHLRAKVDSVLRIDLQKKLPSIKENTISEWTRVQELNRKAYNWNCLLSLDFILKNDDVKIIALNFKEFDLDQIPKSLKSTYLPEDDFDIVASQKDRKLLFKFFHNKDKNYYQQLSKNLFLEDQEEFKRIYYLIFNDAKELDNCRQAEWAKYWPRGFFLNFKNILRKSNELSNQKFYNFDFPNRSTDEVRESNKVKHFKAQIINNIPVGYVDNPKHYLLKFAAPELRYIVPGQFVMVDTIASEERNRLDLKGSIGSKTSLTIKKTYEKVIDLKATSFLKRPFGIHRAYYENFKMGYLNKMNLPPQIASITHTVYPNEFEIFYKVLDNGVGTNELKNAKKNDILKILGPLGARPRIAEWRSKGISEVHLIGGGVGMAPLVFFGQALKYYSFKIKAFIGIDRVEKLLVSAPLAQSFAEDPKDAYVYIKDLIKLGLTDNDIHIAYEKEDKVIHKYKLKRKNYYSGFITQQYSNYLKTRTDTNGILVISCGPIPMLTNLNKIIEKYQIPMKILMEKRMACGIGVCMSCVCKIKKGEETEYSRVCINGPLYDSKDIDWNVLDE